MAQTKWEYLSLAVQSEGKRPQDFQVNYRHPGGLLTPPSPEDPQEQKYETQFKQLGEQRSGFTILDALNTLGEDGWELVLYVGVSYILKRQKS